MKFIVRWVFRLLLLGIVLVVALFLLKDTLIKTLAERRIRAATGMEVKIGRLEVALDRPVIRLENFVLYNPAEFGGSPLLDIPDLHLEYDWDAIRNQELHIKLLRMELREVNLVESKTGQTNFSYLISQMEKNSGPKDRTAGGGSTNQFRGIDTLNLTLGTLRFTSLKDPRRNQEMKLNLKNEVVQNLRTEQDVNLLLFKIMLRQGLTILLAPPHPPAPRQTNPPVKPKV